MVHGGDPLHRTDSDMIVTDRDGFKSGFRLCLSAILCLALLSACGRREDSLLQAGIEKLRTGDFETAVTLLELAAESDPDNASVHGNLGLAYWKLKQPDRAIQEFKTTDRLSRGDERPLEFLGQIYIAERNLDEARRVLELAAQQAPLSVRILTSQAVVEHYAGDADKARTLLENALELNLGYLPAIFNMGLLYRGPLGNKETAARYFSQYLRVAPDGPHKDLAQRLMGVPAASESQYSEEQQPSGRQTSQAEPPKTVQAEPPPDPAAPVIVEARKAIENRELDTALILLNQCLKQSPRSADALWLLAILYDKHLSYQEKADKTYLEFKTRFPNDPRVSSISLPKSPPVSPKVKPQTKPQRTARDPEAARQALRRGVRFYQAREWQNAIEAYNEALALDDQSTDALYNLGLAYKAAGQPEQAKEFLKKAVKLNPDMLTARYMLAVVDRDLKDLVAAIGQLKVVLENDPHYSKAHLLLGLIYRSQGDVEGARRHIQRYINMEPDSRSTEELRSWLKSLNQ